MSDRSFQLAWRHAAWHPKLASAAPSRPDRLRSGRLTHRHPSRPRERRGLLVLLAAAVGLIWWAAREPAGSPRPQPAVAGAAATSSTGDERAPQAVDVPTPAAASSARVTDGESERALEAGASSLAPAWRGGEVQGLLVQPDPAPGAELRLQDLSGIPVYLVPEGDRPALRVESDVQGRFRFVAAEAGRWTLRIASAKRSWVADRILDLDRAPVLLEPIELPALGLVDVSVVDDGGTPVPDLEVRVDATPGGPQPGLRTDATGRVRAHLPAATYRFYASDPRLGRGNRAADLAPDSSVEIEIRLRRTP